MTKLSVKKMMESISLSDFAEKITNIIIAGFPWQDKKGNSRRINFFISGECKSMEECVADVMQPIYDVTKEEIQRIAYAVGLYTLSYFLSHSDIHEDLKDFVDITTRLNQMFDIEQQIKELEENKKAYSGGIKKLYSQKIKLLKKKLKEMNKEIKLR